MLDVKRVLKAAPTKMRSQEPLQQLWTPWGEQIAGEWLSSNDAHKAFCPAKDGERKLENGRTPILNENPRPTMVRGNRGIGGDIPFIIFYCVYLILLSFLLY